MFAVVVVVVVVVFVVVVVVGTSSHVWEVFPCMGSLPSDMETNSARMPSRVLGTRRFSTNSWAKRTSGTMSSSTTSAIR